MRGCEIVVFDVETTGFSKDDEIIQIAARSKNSSFNVYITPTRPIHPKASEATGLKFHNGNLYYHNKRVHSISARNALKNFMNYLRRIKNNVILIAHNCFGFDMPRILRLAEVLGFLDQFKKVVHGFSDSLVILRSILSGQRSGKGKFTLKSLVQDFVVHQISTNNLHNAKCDVEALQLLLFHSQLNVSEELIIQRSKSIPQYYHEQEIKRQVSEAKKSLLCYKNMLSSWTINKMAKTRIDRHCLIDTYQKGGYEAIKKLFLENCHNRPRVTRNKKIISNVCKAIENDLYTF